MIRRAAFVVALASILAGASPLTSPASDAFAEDEPADPVAEAHRLADEAKEYEKTAGDGDIDVAERKTARKAAYDRLKKASDLLDGWLDKHPQDEEKLDTFYCEVRSRLYWVKKMGAVDEFKEGGGGGSGGGATAPPPAGNGGGTTPGTGPTPTPPGKPGTKEEPPKPAPPPAPLTGPEALAEVEAYGAKHKGDVPGLYERYQDFLAKFPDPSTPEYARAMGQVETLSKKLKDVYRLVHDDDPDAVKNVDSSQTEKLLVQLLDDLEKGVPEVRARAAKFLGALGSGKAADPLVKTLKKEKSGQVFDAAADALARIGGRRVCDRLMKAGGEEFLSGTIVDILEKILQRGGPEGRVAGEALGGYIGAIDPEKRAPIFAALAAAGSAGALGVARGVEYAPPEDVAKLVEKLPDAGDPRVVIYIGKLMITNAPGIRSEHSSAARQAVLKIGKPGVRYLIPHLDDQAVAVWTAELLHRITGQKLKDDKRKTWEQWFRMNRKSLEGK